MAGRRRAAGRPRQAERRWSRRRAFLAERLAEATSPAGRVAAAAAFLRAGLGDVSAERAEQAAAEAVRVLTEIGDRLQREETRA